MSGLTLLCAAPGMTGLTSALVDYTPWCEELEIASVSPGGCGHLRARLLLPAGRARLPHPEFAVLNGRVVAQDANGCVFAGEIHEATLALDDRGEAVELLALGGAAALGDDPLDSGYTTQTAQAIIADQFTRRSAYLALDGDQSAVLPSAPSATFSPIFDGRTFEDVLHELCDLLGDYMWSVWPHPVHRDALGLPTWQLQVHPRDVTTVNYRAASRDVVAWRIAPAAARAFNGVTLHYLDPTAGPGAVTVTDPRLNGSLSQGSAPFRFRRFRRDLGGRVLTAAQAATLAQQYLSSFQNIGNVITVQLASARSATGTPLPLWRVRADTNIAVPELLPRAATFPAIPAMQPGSNLFYIRTATYRERRGAAPTLTLQLDQVADFAAADLVRMRYEEQVRQRSRRTSPAVQPAGQTLKGAWSVLWGASPIGMAWGSAAAFASVLAAVPTSLTFTASTATNATGPVAANFSFWGCDVWVTATLATSGNWVGYYTTNGNCLRDVDTLAQTARHHCDACGFLSDPLPVALLITRDVSGPAVSYRATCTNCGAVECFNPALTVADEQDPDPQRAAQAQAIRQVIALVG